MTWSDEVLLGYVDEPAQRYKGPIRCLEVFTTWYSPHQYSWEFLPRAWPPGNILAFGCRFCNDLLYIVDYDFDELSTIVNMMTIDVWKWWKWWWRWWSSGNDKHSTILESTQRVNNNDDNAANDDNASLHSFTSPDLTNLSFSQPNNTSLPLQLDFHLQISWTCSTATRYAARRLLDYLESHPRPIIGSAPA